MIRVPPSPSGRGASVLSDILMSTQSRNRSFKDAFLSPGLGLKAAVLVLLTVLVAAPLLKVFGATLAPGAWSAWSDVLASNLSRNLFWLPLANTMILGAGVATGCVLVGGFLAWLVVMTDVPFRRTIGLLATLPFMIPSFATALAWGSLFRNARVGGQIGFLEGLGFSVPDWLAWGMVPTLVVLIAHYYSLAFTVIAAALATVNSDLVEAAQMTGAGRRRIFLGIILPVALPALVAGASLTFAGAVSNFAAPALLGLPVRMQTLATRLYGMIEIGQAERGYVLAILLILVSAFFLWAGNRVISGRRSYATITGKGGRAKRFALGTARLPLFVAAASICVLTTLVPVAILIASSLAPSSSALFSDWSLHYWIGASDPAIARGQAGIWNNPLILSATGVTVGLGVTVAFSASLVGLLVAFVLARFRSGFLSAAINQISFLPLLVPGIAFGAAYVALLGAPIGPLPALYGTFLLLVVAATAYLVPFAVQTGRAVIQQVSGDLDESARMTGAGFLRRLLAITVPLAIRGLSAGALIVFVKIVRDLSLVVLLFTPTMPLLSVLAYRYASDGFTQFANALTVVVLVISVAATLLANRLQAKSQPWLQS
ncbi:ABC transporter permease subunit [Sinorhizobium medicae]|uniref:ABC transporter permease n=1 Tax=Sinorhizobium medicae TaxID=110321 RepID=UPI0004629859|nr:iron ABC transporter permease [Sinorhizobium medicae]MDX1008428.1 ABC transporter permease subunit [Sinorhizobium medicae]MDX1053658.1 ABC transporter permease subunit [Sinorhizobium medicae]MDX1217456.1 ABC transporter permease subunit [Sinorhizobium medicae]RVJ44293.1 ABC transporter permease subunit [Sinorhizobium medicae]RVQ64420.1 ABC transporter permease subunit [Sinorhizobium medicae]